MNFTGCIECGSLIIENKALHLCASCSARRRKEERQSKTNALKKLPKIQKFSAQKAKKLLPYSVLRRNYLNENPVCELHLQGCNGNSVEVHHCSTSENDYLNVKTWKASCVNCHRLLETKLSAKERRELKLLI